MALLQPVTKKGCEVYGQAGNAQKQPVRSGDPSESTGGIFQTASGDGTEAEGFDQIFEGAKMAVEFKDRLLSQAEEDQLLELISKTAGIDVVCIIDRNQTKEMAYKSVIEHTMTNVRQKDGQFYRGTLRKRQILESDTSVLILGDVEYGAKVIAKGSVVILGRLEGSVHAGACGDDKAYVAALSMKPTYMRIGGVKAGRSQLAVCRQSFKHPQIAVMGENRLVLDSL